MNIIRLLNRIILGAFLVGIGFIVWSVLTETHHIPHHNNQSSETSDQSAFDPNNSVDNIAQPVIQQPQTGTPSAPPPAPTFKRLNLAAFDETLYIYDAHGLIPTISRDGRTVMETYGHRFIKNNTPAISLVFGRLGLNPKLYHQFTAPGVPSFLTLSFSPYGTKNSTWMESFRKKGHELLLELHVETDAFQSAYGPLGLNVNQSENDFISAVNRTLSLGRFYVGCLTTYESTKSDVHRAIQNRLSSSLADRGVLLALPNAHSNGNGQKTISIDMIVPRDSDRFMIRDMLEQAMVKSQKNGHVVVYFDTSPLSLRVALEWLKEMKNNPDFQFVSITDIYEIMRSK